MTRLPHGGPEPDERFRRSVLLSMTAVAALLFAALAWWQWSRAGSLGALVRSPGRLLVLGAWAAFLAALLLDNRARVRTVVTERGVEQPRLRGTRFIAWGDVRSVEARGPFLRLRGPRYALNVDPRTHRDIAELRRFVAEHLPEGVALPHDGSVARRDA